MSGKTMEKRPVQFAHNLTPFCPVCGSGEYMENPDGNKNDFCGQCGTALDWDNAENIDTEEIVKIDRYKHCETCHHFNQTTKGSHGGSYGTCALRSCRNLRSARNRACKRYV